MSPVDFGVDNTPTPVTPALGWRACSKKCTDTASELERLAAGILGEPNPSEGTAYRLSELALNLRRLSTDFGKLPQLEVEAPDAIAFRHAKLMDRFVALIQDAEAWSRALV